MGQFLIFFNVFSKFMLEKRSLSAGKSNEDYLYQCQSNSDQKFQFSPSSFACCIISPNKKTDEQQAVRLGSSSGAQKLISTSMKPFKFCLIPKLRART